MTFNATYVDMGGAPTNQAMCYYINSRNRRVLPQHLFMAASMRARLIRNVSIQNRLVNSTMVVIKRCSNDVIVMCPIGRTREYPICRLQQIIPVHGPSVQVKILQFPMLAGYACTVHGSQGCSYRIVWIDMATFFVAAHAYVALSRARSLQGRYILNYRRAALLVDPYYVQLCKLVCGHKCFGTQARSAFLFTHVEPSHPLSLPGSCVYASHGTPNLISPKNFDAWIVKVNMLLILQYVSFPWWSHIDKHLQGDK